MMTFIARRCRNLILFGIAAAFFFVLYQISVSSLQPTPYYSGWTLLVMMVFLALLNVRKKFSFLPMLGKASKWLQLHLYVGVLTIFIFAMHLQFRMPNGTFETLFALVYIGVVLTGLLGLYMSRAFPKRLTSHGETIFYERISVLRRQICEESEKLVFDSIAETNSTTLPEFYTKRLLPYLKGPRNVLMHLLGSKLPYRRLLNDMDVVERYLNNIEKEVFSDLKEYIESKENLDHQHALQSGLKYWLFVHIPLTYSLLIFLVVHVVVVYAF